MGLFSGNKEELLYKIGQLEAQVQFLTAHNNELKEEKASLLNKIEHLQDAVVAMKNPQAYRMMQDDKLIRDWESNDNNPELPREDESLRAYKGITGILEGSVIRSADDLFSLLGRSQGVPVPAPIGDGKEG